MKEHAFDFADIIDDMTIPYLYRSQRMGSSVVGAATSLVGAASGLLSSLGSATGLSTNNSTSTSSSGKVSSDGRFQIGGAAHIMKEISTLSASLPIEGLSFISVRVDETRMDVIKALMVGPEDTPYGESTLSLL